MSLENIKSAAQGGRLDPPITPKRAAFADADANGLILSVPARAGKQIQLLFISADSDAFGTLQLKSGTELLKTFFLKEERQLFQQAVSKDYPLYAANQGEALNIFFNASSNGDINIQYIYR